MPVVLRRIPRWLVITLVVAGVVTSCSVVFRWNRPTKSGAESMVADYTGARSVTCTEPTGEAYFRCLLRDDAGRYGRSVTVRDELSKGRQGVPSFHEWFDPEFNTTYDYRLGPDLFLDTPLNADTEPVLAKLIDAKVRWATEALTLGGTPTQVRCPVPPDRTSETCWVTGLARSATLTRTSSISYTIRVQFTDPRAR
ncbi:hypothetical protein [Actinokineospora sp. NBRC 105648]|uniref:hypothetical protein n=1 Tax=Actinokineospora sp. NBRC 105648 TaxID=3032206 RepID=UPI0024A2E0C5|nr:hypothetical protein [Actinokineospora sp. NBRC 105648]GLZ42406.1 hypothetical protein Acsp05_60300 [Actinokineospora sp. NBRC 105648]